MVRRECGFSTLTMDDVDVDSNKETQCSVM